MALRCEETTNDGAQSHRLMRGCEQRWREHCLGCIIGPDHVTKQLVLVLPETKARNAQ